MASQSGQRVSSTVLAVNDRGLKLEGVDEWLNISRYARDVVLPERGADAIVSIDKSGSSPPSSWPTASPPRAGHPEASGRAEKQRSHAWRS
ncbi:MAG TPA: hypothetical protein VEQ11_14975 [Chloroflexota bacterium]|nr:hypothetical protein [Chloroflexota bacterium]